MREASKEGERNNKTEVVDKILKVTYGRTVFNYVFNDCVLSKSGLIANPIIAKVDPIP